MQPSENGGVTSGSVAGVSSPQAATSADTAAFEWLSAASAEHSASARSSGDLDSSMRGSQVEESLKPAEADAGRDADAAVAGALTNGALHSGASVNNSSASLSEASLSAADEVGL